MTLGEKVEHGYFAGCIKYENRQSFYLMPIAYWILNMNTYDPSYDPGNDKFVFRNNIAVVTDSEIPNFVEAIECDRINYQVIKDSNLLDVLFFVDFDAKVFISYFPDIEVETHLPDTTWRGFFDDPNKFILHNDIEGV